MNAGINSGIHFCLLNIKNISGFFKLTLNRNERISLIFQKEICRLPIFWHPFRQRKCAAEVRRYQ